MSPVETTVITILEGDENSEVSEMFAETETADYSEVVAELQALNENVSRANEIGEYIYTTLVYIMVMLLIWGVIKLFDSFIKL